jgi:hypothetical protein
MHSALETKNYLRVNQYLVHAAWPEGAAHAVDNRATSIDVADQLRLALRGVGALPEQDDLGLLHSREAHM